MFQYEELRDEVHGALEEVLRAQKESDEQIGRILNAEGLEEAKQLYLIHQVLYVFSTTRCPCLKCLISI